MANGTMSSMDRYLGAVERSAERKRQALIYERQRRDAQESSQIENINSLSGFNAAALRSPKYKEIFENRIADAKNYINGMGAYDGQDYSALEAANKINSLNSLYKKMSAHYGGDVASAMEGNKNSAYSVAEDRVRVNEPGDGSGVAVYENNSPMAYDEAMNRHNNYFEWNGEFDANGNPMGYMIGDDGQPSGDPMSIFEMQAYANPSAFRPPTIEEEIPRLLDVAADQAVNDRFNRLARASKDEIMQMGLTDPKDQHDYVVEKLFNQYMGKDKESVAFRESVIEEVNGMTNSYRPETLKNYIDGNYDLIPEDDLNSINNDAMEAWSNYTYEMPDAPESLHSGVNMHSDNAGFTYQLDAYKEPIEIPAGRSMYSPSNAEDNGYKITAVGINNDGEIVADISYMMSRELVSQGGGDGLFGDGADAEFIDVPTSQTVVIGDPTALSAPEGGSILTSTDDPDSRAFAQEIFYNLPKSEQDRLLKARFETLKQRLGDPTVVQGGEVVSVEGDETQDAPMAFDRSEEAVLQDDPVVRSLVQADMLDISDETVTESEDVDGTPLMPISQIEPNMLNRISDAQQAVKDGDITQAEARTVSAAIRNPNTTPEALDNAIGMLDSAMQEGAEKRQKETEQKETKAKRSLVQEVSPQVIAAARQGKPKAVEALKNEFDRAGLTVDEGVEELESRGIEMPLEVFDQEAPIEPELQAFANLAAAMEDKPTEAALRELQAIQASPIAAAAGLGKQIQEPDGKFLQFGSEAGQPVMSPTTKASDDEVSGVRSSEVQQRIDDATDPQSLVNQEFVDNARNQAAQKVQAEGMPTTPEDLDRIVEEAVTSAQAPQRVEPLTSRAAKAVSNLSDSFRRFITGQPSAGPAVTPPPASQPEATADPAQAPVPSDVAVERERLRRIEEVERLKRIEQELLAKKADAEKKPEEKEFVDPTQPRPPFINANTPIEDGGVAFGSKKERTDAGLSGRRQAFNNAVSLFERLGAPFPKVAASQFVLESEQGLSDLVQETNNGFGIKYDERIDKEFKKRGIEAKKSDKSYYDSTEARTGAADPNAFYFSFPNLEEGFKGYLAFIEMNPRYAKALAAESETDYLRLMTEAGYATGNDGKGGGYIDAVTNIASGYGVIL